MVHDEGGHRRPHRRIHRLPHRSSTASRDGTHPRLGPSPRFRVRMEGQTMGENAIVRWELRPEGEETLLTLTHRNLTRRSALGAAPATHVVLERLVAQLAGLPFEDFRERVAQVQEQYPSRREAH